MNEETHFITKKNLDFYHRYTVNKLKNSIAKINENIGDINFADKFDEIMETIDEEIENVKMKGLSFDEDENTTTFINDGEEGDVIVNDLYVKRNNNYLPLSEIIGGIDNYANAKTTFNSDIDVPTLISDLVKSDEIYLLKTVTNSETGEDEIVEENIRTLLNTKSDLFSYRNIYVILDNNEDIQNGTFYIDEAYTEPTDFYNVVNDIIKYPEKITRGSGRGGSSINTIDKASFVNLHIYKNSINRLENLDSEFNLEQLLFNETCLLYYTCERSGSVSTTTTTSFYGKIYSDFIFSLSYTCTETRTGATTITGPYISLVQNKSVTDLLIDSKRAISASAVLHVTTEITETLNNYITKNEVNNIIENLENDILTDKKLLYSVTRRVDNLDMNNIDVNTVSLLTTLTKNNNYITMLSSADLSMIIEKYGESNIDYLLFFNLFDTVIKKYIEQLKIGLRVAYKNPTTNTIHGCTIVDIYTFTSSNNNQYSCVCLENNFICSKLKLNTSVDFYLFTENIDSLEPPSIEIRNIGQTSAKIHLNLNPEGTNTHVILKKVVNSVETVINEWHIANNETSWNQDVTDLDVATTYRVYACTTFGLMYFSYNTSQFLTDDYIEPKQVSLYFLNGTTNRMIEAYNNIVNDSDLAALVQQTTYEEALEENNLYMNGIIYESDKFNYITENTRTDLKYIFNNICNLQNVLHSDKSEGVDPSWLLNETNDVIYTLNAGGWQYIIILPSDNQQQIPIGFYNATLSGENGYITSYTIDTTDSSGDIVTCMDYFNDGILNSRTLVSDDVYKIFEFTLLDDIGNIKIFRAQFRNDVECPLFSTIDGENNLFKDGTLNSGILGYFYIISMNNMKIPLRIKVNHPDDGSLYIQKYCYDFLISCNETPTYNAIIKPDYLILGNKLRLHCENTINWCAVLVYSPNENTYFWYDPIVPSFYNIPGESMDEKYIMYNVNENEIPESTHNLGENFILQLNPFIDTYSGKVLTVYFTYGLINYYDFFDMYQYIGGGRADAYFVQFNNILWNNHLIYRDDNEYNKYDSPSNDPRSLEPYISMYFEDDSAVIEGFDVGDPYTFAKWVEYYENDGFSGEIKGKGLENHICACSDIFGDPSTSFKDVIRPGLLALQIDFNALQEAYMVHGYTTLTILLDFKNGKNLKIIIYGIDTLWS